MAVGAPYNVGRRPKDHPAPEGKGVLVRISKDAVTILRRLSGFLEKPMSDVVSELIIKHGKPELQRLMNEEQEKFRSELKIMPLPPKPKREQNN